MPERFECTSFAKKALYKCSPFPFLSFPFLFFLANLLSTAESENESVSKIGQHLAKQWARAQWHLFGPSTGQLLGVLRHSLAIYQLRSGLFINNADALRAGCC